MVYAPAFTPSSVFPLGVLPRAWLRPDRLRRFKAFLASSTCQSSASSYGVGSAAHSRPILSPGLTLRSSRPPTAAAELRALVPSPVSCAQPPVPALRPVPKAFKPFGPPALVQQAPPAILLAALRRFRGPAVFRGPRPSSRLGAPFWPSGLTLRSSGPAFCGPLTLAVSLL